MPESDADDHSYQRAGSPAPLPRLFWCGALWLAVLSFSLSQAHAQLPNAELHTLSPPVIAAGKTSEISLTGTNLDGLKGLHFSDNRITAEPVLLPASEFRKAPVQDGTKFRVTVPAEIGDAVVEVRTIGYLGFSTSRPLSIAATGTETMADSAGNAHHQLESAPVLPRDAIAYGTTDADAIDYWKFTAKKGERILVHCRAERIDSHCDATLEIVDRTGRELETNRDFIGRDPMIDFTAPADGDYWVGVHDFLYGGGVTYPYLLTITTRPWIDAVFPPAGQQGQVMEATLLGRNLPGGSPGDGLSIDGKPIETLPVRIQVPAEPGPATFEWERPTHALLADFSYRLGNSNAIEIGFAGAPVIAVTNDADIPAVTPPCEIAARFDEDGDSDQFRFVAKKGTAYAVEVIGDRLAGRIDPYLVVEKIAKGEEETETFTMVRDGDDNPDRAGATFDAGSRDISLTFTADQDGEYRVTVVNQFAGGGPAKHYRLAIREAMPAFDVLAINEREYLDARNAYPAPLLLRKGGTASLRLVVDRRDGFDGPVTVTAEGLPEKVQGPPLTIAGGDTSGRLVFAAAADATPWNGTLKLIATAKIGENETSQPVRSGTIVWGTPDTNTARVRARLETDIPLAVSESEVAPITFSVHSENPLTVTLGEKLEIPVKATAMNGIKGNVAISPDGLHGLSRPPSINFTEKAMDGKLTLDFKTQNNIFNPQPGTWSFVLKASGTTKYRYFPEAVDRATEEQKLAETLIKQSTEAAAKAKTATSQAETALAEARKQLEAAGTPEAKTAAEKTVANATAAVEAARKTIAEAEQKKSAAEKAKADAANRLKAATNAAKEKDVKFVSYSLPITVEVKPAPEAKK
ncbi:MAG: hypothetical protein KDN19_10570 [Verrucomicrobiae bacterium]|nr:hypothetical protein [Verrucomicrobiae bacterium]